MMKFRLYYDKDREEIFLNKMSEKGYAMEKFFLGFYTFKPSQPGEYTYRVDLIEGKTIEENNAFYDLVRETGGEVVQTWGFWAYYRKKGKFELYTDKESQIQQHKKIRKVYFGIGMLELGVSIMQLVNYNRNKEFLFLFLSILFFLIFIGLMIEVRTSTKKISELSRV